MADDGDINLMDCIQSFTKEEVLDGDERPVSKLSIFRLILSTGILNSQSKESINDLCTRIV